MQTEVKLAFRGTVSEVLLYMAEPGRSAGETLNVLYKLENTVVNIIHLDILASMPEAGEYVMNWQNKVLFRSQIAALLEVISRPDTLPPKIMAMIQDIEKWMEEQAENFLRITAKDVIGKPKMTVTKLPPGTLNSTFN